jgi:hypothetical protein
MEIIFETAARAYRDGILELQQEQMEMVFWNRRRDILEMQPELMEMV